MSKRSTALIACNRCIAAKRKCDGDFASGQSCRNCKKGGSHCEYNKKRNPSYMRLMEQRVAFLEQKLKDRESANAPGDLVELSNSDDGNNMQRSIFISSKSGPTYDSACVNFGAILQGHAMYGLPITEKNSRDTAFEFFYDDLKQQCHEILTGLERLLQNECLTIEYFENYFTGIHVRYPFLEKTYVKSLHDNRLSMFVDQGNNTEYDGLENQMDRFILLMVYAIGSRTTDDNRRDDSLLQNHSIFYKSALCLNLNQRSLFGNIAAVHALLLLVIYQLRFASGPAIWHFAGSVLRLCVNLDLHSSNLKFLKDDPHNYVMRCKTFWSAYCLERLISTTFGRPYSLSDRDIKLDFPIDLDETIKNPTRIKTKFYQTYPHHNLEGFVVPNEAPSEERTLLSLAIIHIKFRKIESKIRSTIYRTDRNFHSISRSEIENLLEETKVWENSLPKFLTINEYDYWSYMFHKQIRFLIQPYLQKLNYNDPLFLECIESCISICNLSKKIHRINEKITYLSLQTVFLSGMNLIYGLVSKKCFWSLQISEAIRNCTAFLVKLSERTKGCEKYYETFEKSLVQAVEGQNDIEKPNNKASLLDRLATQFSSYDSLNMKGVTNSIPSVDLLFGQNEANNVADQGTVTNSQKVPEKTMNSFDPEWLIDFDLLLDQDLLQRLGDLNSFPTNWGFDL